MKDLQISQFSSFFELLTGFYIFLGISNSLSEPFNIYTWIKNFINDAVKSDINSVIDQNIEESIRETNIIKENFKTKIDHTDIGTLRGKIQFMKITFQHLLKRKKQLPKHCSRYLIYEKLEATMFYNEKEDSKKEKSDYCSDKIGKDLKKLQGAFIHIINPVYLYFGLTNFIILIVTGFIEDFDKPLTFQLINAVSIIVITSFIIQLFSLTFLNKLLRNINKRNVVILQVILLAVYFSYLIFCPTSSLSIGKTVNYNLNNFNIILCIFLPLFPLFVHIAILYRMVRLHKRIKSHYLKTYQQEPPQNPQIFQFG